MKTELLRALLAELRELLEPLADAAEDESSRYDLFQQLGWNIDSIEDFPLAELAARLSDLHPQLAVLADAVEHPPDSFEGYADVLAAAAELYGALRELHTLGSGMDPSLPFHRLGVDLMEYLTVEYLIDHHPLVHDLAMLLTVIEPGEHPPEVIGDFSRTPPARSGLHPERLVGLLRDPMAVLRPAYFPSGSLETAEQAKELTDKLFPRLGAMLGNFGWSHLYGLKPMYELDLGETGNALAAGMLTLLHSFEPGTGFGATLSLSSRDRGNLGLMITPYGLVTFSHELAAWQLEVEAQAAVEGFAIGPAGLTLPEGIDDATVGARFTLTQYPDDVDGGFVLDLAGQRLEAGRLSIEGSARFTGDQRDYGLLLRAHDAAMVLGTPDGDGFLGSVLGGQGVRAEFELGLGWSNRRGLYLEGGAGLETRLPVRHSAGPVRADAVDLGVHVGDDAIRLRTGLTFTIQLGPMMVTVEGAGLQVTLGVGEDGGNLGMANLAFGVSPPTGLTIKVASDLFTGGGFLSYDPDRREYSGMVRLKHRNLVLTALGILSTRRPDGQPGYSLILLITGEFPPVQLGFGFTLNGVGGLLGVNRTANVQALQEGVRARALDAVLFPERPLENAPRILSDLQTYFPVGEGTYLFGPMARIGWGPVPILLAELGIALEFPDPLRLLIFGQLHLGLPSLDRPLLDAHLELFGSINFDAGTLAIDASLVDSSIAGYRIGGDAAVRARWKGDDPEFALAIGGFHPGAQPPAGFPALRRVSVNLSSGDNPRLRLAGYFALTSNSVQCGARVEAYAKKSKFSVEAFLSFDTLFQFDPFRFVVELAAGAVVKAFNRTVTTVDLELSLSGPHPWHASGKASFKIIWSYTVSFDLTIGDQPDTSAVAPVDLRALMLDELRRPSSWSGQLPPRDASSVALRDVRLDDTTDLMLHPQGRFGVRQTVLPLSVTVDKYGERPPKDDSHFVISQVRVGGQPVEHVAVSDRYAPAQYFDLTQAQRLTAPAYQRFDSGIAATPDTAAGGDRVSVRPQYEQVVVDVARGDREVTGRTEPASGALARVHQRSAVASALRRQRDTVAFPGPVRRIRLHAPRTA